MLIIICLCLIHPNLFKYYVQLGLRNLHFGMKLEILLLDVEIL